MGGKVYTSTPKFQWRTLFTSSTISKHRGDDEEQRLTFFDGNGDDEKQRLTAPDECSDNDRPQQPWTLDLRSRNFVILQLGLFCLYTTIFLVVTRLFFQKKVNELLYTPASSVSHTEVKELHTHLFEKNPYKGFPSPELDAAWDGLFANSYIRLSKQDLESLGRSSTLVQDGSGDFLGSLDMYHQLHCVRYIYQYVHNDYYAVNRTNISVPDHINHCLDMLRQIIMCRADTAIMTFSYHSDHPIAWPDFNMPRECRNWDSVDEWAGKSPRAMDQSDPERFHRWISNPDFEGGIFDGHDA